MSEKKFEFHFHASVGQNIANVEHMDVHLDKDASVQIANIEQADIEKQKITTPTIGKTITPKKSKHFLETATFKYRYLNTDEGNRRLYLLYQFLSREYRETKSYIDPEIAPDDFYSLFSGETNNTVITWTGSKQDLYYLIKRMVDRHIIDIPSSTTIWTITQNHFSDRRGNIFLDLRNQHKPKTSAEAIEHLIDILDPAATTPADLTELSKKLSTAFGGK